MKTKRAPACPKVFISYSRRDFALAEAVAATLSKQGRAEPWLDSENLTPGMDWDSAIEQAIDDAEIFLLIASPAALASPYVTREWTRALEGRKNIHICVVEAVDLPAELASYPVHDLRSQFWRRAQGVGYVIAARGSVSVAPVRGLSLVPAPVAALLVAALIITFTSLWAAWETWYIYSTLRDSGRFSDEPLKPIILLMEIGTFVGTGLTMLAVAMQVPWRRSSGSALGANLVVSAIGGFWLLSALVTLAPRYPELSSSFEARAVLGTALLTASAVGIGLMRSQTIHLWLPTGEGDYEVRQRIFHRKVQHRGSKRIVGPRFEYVWAPYAIKLAALPMVNTATTFEIRWDEGDEGIGQLIKRACIDAGMVEATSAVTWVLRLVSSKTDYARACEEIAELGARVICILVDSVSLPEDSRELRRRQWLDFREQLPEGLYNLLRVLRGADYTAGGSNPVPLDTSRFRVPMEVQYFVDACRFVLIMIGAFSIGLVVLHPLQRGAINLALVSLLPEIYLWRLLRSTTARLETGRNFRVRCGVFLLLVLMWTGYMGAMNLWLLVPGATVVLIWLSGIVSPYRHLPTYWLPLSATANKTPAVMPPMFASYIPGLVVMSFAMGLAATPLLLFMP